MENLGGDDVFVDPKLEPGQLSPLVLAYVGDAVYELFIRAKLAVEPAKMQSLHQAAVKYVQASAQAEFIKDWEHVLTAEEKDVVRRGRNAKGGVPQHGDMMEYRYSTGFEALIGYLYLTGQRKRLLELLGRINPSVNS